MARIEEPIAINIPEDENLSPATVPKFEFPEFDPNDIDFTERKTSPLDLSPIFKQVKQRQAITGVEPSAAFVSGIAEPALREKTRESIAFEELNLQRQMEERKQAFTEFEAERGIEFEQFQFEREREFREEELEIARIQAENTGGGGGGCIIVTACHGEESGEVNVTREYRDRFMDKDTLRGYYMLAEQIVPTMKSDEEYRQHVKESFVNHFIEVGKFRLGKIDTQPSEESINITDGFLNTCNILGSSVDSFTRSNGEVI